VIIQRGTLYLANLEPRVGTEAGKVRPVLVIQSDLLNETGHQSTWVLPCTTRLTGENILRVMVPKGMAGNPEDCEVMIDQSRAIDNRRFARKLKPLPEVILREVEEKLRSLAEL
jgi:mRNA interferase MazF